MINFIFNYLSVSTAFSKVYKAIYRDSIVCAKLIPKDMGMWFIFLVLRFPFFVSFYIIVIYNQDSFDFKLFLDPDDELFHLYMEREIEVSK
jgi:hypothetical protein